MSILVIAEKPSVSRELAKVLGADQNRKTHIDGSGYMVSWCLGHLVGLKYPNDYGNNWSEKWSFSQLPMIPSEWLFKVSENTKEQFHVLKDLMSRSDVTEIICATDADREGECIFRYVYHMAKCRKPVKRLWVSSLEESAIRKALADMKPMCTYDNLYHAGYSRAKADWLVGMNASRLFSVRYHLPLNIGRVQTPTLAMIVKRDFEVNHFVKQKYFTCELDCGGFTLSSARMDEENRQKEIAKQKASIEKELKSEIEKMNSKYDKKYKNMKKQYNWLLVPIFKQLRNKYSVSDFFRPHGPTDHKWLSNFDIQDVMKQYELVYPDYKFLGAVPRDFDNFKYWNFSNIDYNNYYDNNNKKTRFGVIFNNDSSGQSGSHWTALFFDMNKSQIYFQDSVGYEPNKEIKTLIKSIEHQMKGDIDNQYSTMDHQHGNSECGVYSLSFILRLLNGESFNDIQSTRLDDNNVNKCRAIYFNNID